MKKLIKKHAILLGVLLIIALISFLAYVVESGLVSEAMYAEGSYFISFAKDVVHRSPKENFTGQEILKRFGKKNRFLESRVEYYDTTKKVSKILLKHTSSSDYGEPVAWIQRKSFFPSYTLVIFSNYRYEFVPEEIVTEFIENGEDPKFLNTQMLDSKISKH